MPKPVDNPKRRWGTESVGYLDGFSPDARVKVLQDQSRSIVTKNYSPDLGFDYSLNPYQERLARPLSPSTFRRPGLAGQLSLF